MTNKATEDRKIELLGTIQRLLTSIKEKKAVYKGQHEMLKEVDDALPAKQAIIDLAEQRAELGQQLSDQRNQSEDWRVKKANVEDAKADLDTFQGALSEALVLYMVETKSKAVHAYADEPAEVDREIITTAKVGGEVAANLSLFDGDGEDI